VEQPKFIAAPDRLAGEREERIELGRRTLSFGVKFLDNALGGILPRDVVLLGAKTGVGKTALATSIALQNAVAGKRVHYFALEAEEREIERRMKFQLVASLYFQSGAYAKTEIRYLDWYKGKLDDVLGPFEDRADTALRKGLGNLKTFYRERSFTSDDFARKLEQIKTETDLVVLDHLHYVDSDDDNENRGYKRTVKQVRDAAIESGKPVILVAHVRKGDRRYEPLVPTVEDFHGSSDIPKIATKAAMIAPAYDQPNQLPYLWNTYIQVAKCRLDGAVTRYVGLAVFNSRLNVYENDYTLGRLTEGGKKFEPVDASDLPGWAKQTVVDPSAKDKA
jgi:replicative DNA helicase